MDGLWYPLCRQLDHFLSDISLPVFGYATTDHHLQGGYDSSAIFDATTVKTDIGSHVLSAGVHTTTYFDT